MKKILSLTVLFTFSLTIFSQGLDPDEKLNMPLVWGKNQAVWINKTIGKIDLNSNEAIFDENLQETENFCLGKDNLITVYGRGNEPARKFFDEHLPAIFKRTIDFTKFDPGNNGELWWIFTGDQGGFTVLIKNNRIDLVQRYYNSFGLNDFSGDSVNAKRFPQKETVNTSVEFDGKIRTVSIEITHEMQIYMYINGYLAARQLCLLDISRHQLKCTSKQSDICGTMYKPVAQPADFEIFSSEKKQTILGFGGITSVPAFNLLSEEGKKQWWKYIQEYKLLLHREYPIGTNLNENMDNWDNVHDAVPHYYADNFNNSEISDFEYIKKIRGMDGIVIFEFWILPDWAVTIDEDYKEHTKWNVRIPIIEKYCEAMINYCKTSVEKTGKAPEIVGIQNEVPQSGPRNQRPAPARCGASSPGERRWP